MEIEQIQQMIREEVARAVLAERSRIADAIRAAIVIVDVSTNWEGEVNVGQTVDSSLERLLKSIGDCVENYEVEK